MAGQLTGRSFVIYDRDKGQVVARDDTVEEKLVPRFTRQRNRLALITRTWQGPVFLRWYEHKDGKWILDQSVTQFEQGERIGHIGDHHLVTERLDLSKPAWLSKLPQGVQSWISRFQPFQRVHVRLWSFESGELVCVSQRSFPLTGEFFGYQLFNQYCCSSATGHYLILRQDRSSFTIWTSEITKPWSCWLTVAAMVGVAWWVGRPRKSEPATSLSISG